MWTLFGVAAVLSVAAALIAVGYAWRRPRQRWHHVSAARTPATLSLQSVTTLVMVRRTFCSATIPPAIHGLKRSIMVLLLAGTRLGVLTRATP
jgi:hypothetical protein